MGRARAEDPLALALARLVRARLPVVVATRCSRFLVVAGRR
jgi:hypothetical protein